MATEKKFSNGIWECLHCGERMGTAKQFCGQCGSAEGRAKMDQANKEIFAASGLEFHCKYCEKRRAIKK